MPNPIFLKILYIGFDRLIFEIFDKAADLKDEIKAFYAKWDYVSGVSDAIAKDDTDGNLKRFINIYFYQLTQNQIVTDQNNEEEEENDD